MMSRAALTPIATALALCLAQPLLAQAQPSDCPSGPAIEPIYMEYPDRVVRYQRLDDGNTSEVEIVFGDATVFEYRTHPIGLIVESWEVQGGGIVRGTTETATMQGTPDPLPAPAPGAIWDGLEITALTDGTDMRVSVSLSVGAPEPFVIGPCSYTSLPITMNRVDIDFQSLTTTRLMVIRELGITIYLGDLDTDGTPTFAPPISISTVQPAAMADVMETTPPPEKK